jgi:hypothetical protein
MNNIISGIDNDTNNTWDYSGDGPTLRTRIAFASAWAIIAVAGIIGKKKFFFLLIFI